MKKSFTILILFLFFPVQIFANSTINGELDEVEGIPILRVWGTPYEMGYAHGALLGPEIKSLFADYVMRLVLGSSLFYESAYTLFDSLWIIPERYLEEARGQIDGAKDNGVDFYIPALDREIAEKDILMVGAMADIIGLFACSSLVAWDEATMDDPELLGDAAIVRNLDWLPLPSDPTYLSRSTLLFVRQPDEGHGTVSIAFPGFLGCLSCMNEAGVTAVQHQVHPGLPIWDVDYSTKFIPINLAMLEGLELEDPDGNGAPGPSDEAFTIESLPRSSAYNIICVGPDSEADPPFVLEANNAQTVRRYDIDDADFPEKTLAATNHIRKLKDPKLCLRYGKIKRNVNEWDGLLTLDRLWQTGGDVAVDYFASITAQTLLFIPNQKMIGIAYSDKETLAPDKQPVWVSLDDLFIDLETDDPPSEDDDTVEDDDIKDDDDAVDSDNDNNDDDDSDESCCG